MTKRNRPPIEAPPKIPDLSTRGACRDCVHAADRDRFAKIRHLHAQAALPTDEVLCLFDPGGGKVMKTWGYCAQFKEHTDS